MARISKSFLSVAVLAIALRGGSQQIKEPVDYVDPNIGDVPQTPLDRVYLEKRFFPALKVGEEETVKEVNPFKLSD